MKSLTIMIPAFNEEENISNEISKVKDCLSKYNDSIIWSIMVIDDGSTDSTAQIVSNIVESDNRITMISHTQNSGVGVAIYTALSNIENDWAFLHPADGQFDINEIDKFVQLMDSADIILGYKEEGHKSAYRRILTKMNMMLTKLLFKLDYKNVTWVTMYKMEFVRKINLKMRSPIITTEIIYLAKRCGANIIEVETKVYDRQAGKPSAARFTQIIKSVLEIIKLRLVTWGIEK